MNFNILYEAVRQEYYEMDVVKVASNHPLELLRILFDMFEDMVFPIPNETKQQYVEEYRKQIDEFKNPWTENNNKNAIYFDTIETHKKKSAPGYKSSVYNNDTDNEIAINFYGSRVKIGIQNKSANIYETPKKWDVSGQSVREFFTKLFTYFNELLKVDRSRRYRDDSYNPEITQNPDLYKPENKMETLLNKMWNKHNLAIRDDNRYRQSQGNLIVKLDYSSLGKEFKPYGQYNLTDIKYSFQIKLLEKFFKYIVGFLNNRNNYITNFSKNNDGFNIYYMYAEDGNKQNSKYGSGKTYLNIQNSALNSLPETLNSFNVEDITQQEWQHRVVKKIYKTGY